MSFEPKVCRDLSMRAGWSTDLSGANCLRAPVDSCYLSHLCTIWPEDIGFEHALGMAHGGRNFEVPSRVAQGAKEEGPNGLGSYMVLGRGAKCGPAGLLGDLELRKQPPGKDVREPADGESGWRIESDRESAPLSSQLPGKTGTSCALKGVLRRLGLSRS